MLTEEQIWNYLDNRLSPEERKEVEDMKAENAEAAALFQEISALQAELLRQPLMTPSASFTDNVMSSIDSAPAAFSIKPYLLFALPSLLCVAGLIALLVYTNIPFSDSLNIIPLVPLKHPGLYFAIMDVLLFAYLFEQWPARKRKLPTIPVLL